ncbi:MAG: hypothetical protein AABY14_01805, partial [Nanoarchaeota archaeon]
MTIQSDAKEILQFTYDEYIQNRGISPENLKEKFNSWDGGRIDRAVKYLSDERLIKIVLLLGEHQGIQNFIF